MRSPANSSASVVGSPDRWNSAWLRGRLPESRTTRADPSSTNTGHLVNGAFFLPQKLQAGTGTAFAPVGGSAAPTNLKSWSAPTSNESVAINFKQSIGANDALRTGTYAKTLTFTLSTTQP